jgi:hypothetical protein
LSWLFNIMLKLEYSDPLCLHFLFYIYLFGYSILSFIVSAKYILLGIHAATFGRPPFRRCCHDRCYRNCPQYLQRNASSQATASSSLIPLNLSLAFNPPSTHLPTYLPTYLPTLGATALGGPWPPLQSVSTTNACYHRN